MVESTLSYAMSHLIILSVKFVVWTEAAANFCPISDLYSPKNQHKKIIIILRLKIWKNYEKSHFQRTLL